MRRSIMLKSVVILILLSLISLIIYSIKVNLDKKDLETIISKQLLLNVNSIVVCTNSNYEQLSKILEINTISSENVRSISECSETIAKGFAFLTDVSNNVYEQKLSNDNRLDIVMNQISSYIVKDFKENGTPLSDDRKRKLTLINQTMNSVLETVNTSFPHSSNQGIDENYYSSKRSAYIKSKEWRAFVNSIEKYSNDLPKDYVNQIS